MSGQHPDDRHRTRHPDGTSLTRITPVSPQRPAGALLRGALGSLHKRGPYEDARLPAEQLVLPGAWIDTARLRRYAEVCGEPRAEDDAAPVPPGYPHVLGFPLAMRLMADPGFPFPLLGLVHTRIGVTQRRALRADERPEIRVHAEGPAPHRRGSIFDVVTSVLVDDQEVWHSRSSYLCRHRTHTQPPAGPSGSSRADGPLPVRATWELPEDLGRRYAAASGDRNPIHLHALAARPFGFPRAIAHGMWSFARCLATARAGQAGYSERLTAHAEFKAPVPLPGTVTYGERDGTFELRGGPDGRRLHLTGQVTSDPPSSGSPGRPSRSS